MFETKRNRKRGKPRFRLDTSRFEELRRKVPADDHALLDRIREAVHRDPNATTTAHVIGQAAGVVVRGYWDEVELDALARAAGTSAGTLHDCRQVAGMWTEQEIAGIGLKFSMLVTIARGAPGYAKRHGTAVGEARDTFVRLATTERLPVRKLRMLMME